MPADVEEQGTGGARDGRSKGREEQGTGGARDGWSKSAKLDDGPKPCSFHTRPSCAAPWSSNTRPLVCGHVRCASWCRRRSLWRRSTTTPGRAAGSSRPAPRPSTRRRCWRLTVRRPATCSPLPLRARSHAHTRFGVAGEWAVELPAYRPVNASTPALTVRSSSHHHGISARLPEPIAFTDDTPSFVLQYGSTWPRRGRDWAGAEAGPGPRRGRGRGRGRGRAGVGERWPAGDRTAPSVPVLVAPAVAAGADGQPRRASVPVLAAQGRVAGALVHAAADPADDPAHAHESARRPRAPGAHGTRTTGGMPPA